MLVIYEVIIRVIFYLSHLTSVEKRLYNLMNKVQSLTLLSQLQMLVKQPELARPVLLVYVEEKENLLKDMYENIYNINFRSSIAYCNRAFLFLSN